MTNDSTSQAARIADILGRYTNRTIIQIGSDGLPEGRQPSLRSIERATGIAHQRISEFLRAPEGATAAMLDRMTGIVESPALVSVDLSPTGRVSYMDFPAFSPAALTAVPENAAAYRFVIQTDDDRYKGFRSSEWLADFDNIDNLAASVPGGRDAIERIVFDVGE